MSRLAKLTRPRTEGLVVRERLFEDLDAACDRPVVWISGPPGAGKTSLVSSYLEARERSCLWYQVDGGDADPATFFHYLGIAAETVARKKHKGLPLFTDEYAADLEGFARRFFRALYAQLGSHVALVLDNYQEVPEAAAFHVAVRVAAEELPEGVTLCAVSRVEPPAELARVRASQQLTLIGWNQLKLTEAETAAIARGAGTDAATVAQLHEQSNGWAAGVVLMLERIRQTGGIRLAITHENLETIFQYFAGQVFHAAPQEAQELLLRMAQLPRLTAETAQVVTGNPEAAKLLATLAKRNLFIDRRYGEQTSYQFHALFREFLKAEARERLGAAELQRVTHSAAALLQATGQAEDAFELFVQEGAWESAASLIKAEAPKLVEQARRETLWRWIEVLPLEQRRADGWLMLWYGLAASMPARERKLSALERAFEIFEREADAVGQANAAVAMVDAIYSSPGDLRQLDRWISVLDVLLSRSADLQDDELRARMQSRFFRAVFTREPTSARTHEACRRTRTIVDSDISVATKYFAAATIAVHNWILGYLNSTDDLISAMRSVPVTDALANDASVRLYRYFVEFQSQMRIVVPRDPLQALPPEREAESVIGPLNADLYRREAHELILGRRYAEARRLLEEKVEPDIESVRTTMRGFGYWHLATCALAEGRKDQVLRYVTAALRVLEMGANSARLFLAPYLAGLLAAAGSPMAGERVIRSLHEDFDVADNDWLFGRATFLRAFIALKRGERDFAVRDLREALSRLARVPYVAWIVFPDPDFDRLFALALEHGIESEFVTGLIRNYGIPAPDPDLDHWPWPLKLKLLGRFGVDGIHENTSGKAQHRLNELLKTIAVRGPEGVSLQALADELWPDSEGDAAFNSAQVSLYRLRKRLGRDDAIRVRDGIVSIDRGVCWVDAWAFESKVAQALAAKEEMAEFEPLARMALSLYTGHLLDVDSDSAWTLSARQRLRRQWQELIVAFGGALEGAGRVDESADLFERALDRDPEAEVLYRYLMLCCMRLGQTTRATAAFERCRQILAERQGIEPSAELRQIHRSITAGKS